MMFVAIFHQKKRKLQQLTSILFCCSRYFFVGI